MSLDLPVDTIPEIPRQETTKPLRRKLQYFEWNDSRINNLKQWWGENQSASQIAVQLGCTRNAVIGKVWRLGLPPHKAERVQDPNKPRKVVMRMKPRLPIGPPMAPQALPVAAPLPSACEPVGIEALQDHHCRYIVSPDGEEIRYCGASREHVGVPYCAYHVKRCYNSPPQR